MIVVRRTGVTFWKYWPPTKSPRWSEVAAL